MRPPILGDKVDGEPSVFRPEGLLREARRQKGPPDRPTPPVWILDPDGDIVRHALGSGLDADHGVARRAADTSTIKRSGKADIMRNVLVSLLLATAVGFGASAHAADPPKPAKSAGHAGMGPGMMGHGMMMHGAMDMAAMHCMGLSEQRLAAAKTELKITDAQTAQWNAFVEAEKSSAAAMGPGMMQGAGHDHGAHAGSGMMMTGPLPERLERHEAMMTAHLEALKKVRAAVSPLYDALTPDQKAKADHLLCGGMGGHGQGMPEGRHAHPHRPQ